MKTDESNHAHYLLESLYSSVYEMTGFTDCTVGFSALSRNDIRQNQNINQTFHKKTNRIKHVATINILLELFCPTKKQYWYLFTPKKIHPFKLKNTYFCPPSPPKNFFPLWAALLLPRFRVLGSFPRRCLEASIDGTWLSQLKAEARRVGWRLKKNNDDLKGRGINSIKMGGV